MWTAPSRLALVVVAFSFGCGDDDSPTNPADPSGPSSNRCGWTADAAGVSAGSWDGEVATLSDLGGSTEIIFRTDLMTGNGPHGLVVFDCLLADGQTGTFPVAVVFDDNDGGVFASVETGTMSVSTFTGDFLVGELTATMASTGGSMTLEMEFTAGTIDARGSCFD